MASELLEWDVAEGATNTPRPLTHSLDCRKEGLAVHASRRSGPRFRALRRFQSRLQLEFDYAVAPEPETPQIASEADSDACVAYEGKETKWRQKAVELCWNDLGIDHASLSWPTPSCGTPLCLNLTHLTWESPKALQYPPWICVYCGMPAPTKDHLLPRTWTGEAIRLHVLTVPACLECNSAIGDRYMPSVTERRAFAHEWIIKRYKKILGMPEWTDEDMKGMGRTLRSAIERGIHDRKVLRARLAWPEEAEYDERVMTISGIANPYEIGLLTRPQTEQLNSKEAS